MRARSLGLAAGIALAVLCLPVSAAPTNRQDPAQEQFLEHLDGTWVGHYCGGAGNTTVLFMTLDRYLQVVDQFCRFVCAKVTYDVTDVDVDRRTITLSSPTDSLFPHYELVLTETRDGHMDGYYINHPSCHDMQLDWTQRGYDIKDFGSPF